MGSICPPKHGNFLVTSESVNEGDHDKLADQVSNAVLDACLREDPQSRVACETATKTNMIMAFGGIMTSSTANIEDVVRRVAKEVGYDSDDKGLNYRTMEVINKLEKKSPDIAQALTKGVEELGAGDQLTKDVIEHVVKLIVPAYLLDENTIYHINPSGRFVIGGPHGDAGLTGRKIIIDTYGGWGAHGGGAFSGKDTTKVDRIAAYAARWAAKSLVAVGLAKRCLVQCMSIYEIDIRTNNDKEMRAKVEHEKINDIPIAYGSEGTSILHKGTSEAFLSRLMEQSEKLEARLKEEKEELEKRSKEEFNAWKTSYVQDIARDEVGTQTDVQDVQDVSYSNNFASVDAGTSQDIRTDISEEAFLNRLMELSDKFEARLKEEREQLEKQGKEEFNEWKTSYVQDMTLKWHKTKEEFCHIKVEEVRAEMNEEANKRVAQAREKANEELHEEINRHQEEVRKLQEEREHVIALERAELQRENDKAIEEEKAKLWEERASLQKEIDEHFTQENEKLDQTVVKVREKMKKEREDLIAVERAGLQRDMDEQIRKEREAFAEETSIRNERSDGGYSAQRADLSRKIDEFVKDNNLDERADTILRETEEEVLRELFLLPLHDARNPSALVLTRIRNIIAEQCDRRRRGVTGPYTAWTARKQEYAPPPPRVTTNRKELDEKIEKFIIDNELDERVSAELKSLDSEMLGEVCRGSLGNARNTNAVMKSRIREVKSRFRAPK